MSNFGVFPWIISKKVSTYINGDRVKTAFNGYVYFGESDLHRGSETSNWVPTAALNGEFTLQDLVKIMDEFTDYCHQWNKPEHCK